MVKLLCVDALGVTNGFHRAALAHRLAYAYVRDLLHHAPHCLLVGVVVRHALALLLVGPQRRPFLFHRLRLRLFFLFLDLRLRKREVDDDMVGLVDQRNVNIIQILVESVLVLQLVVYHRVFLLQKLDRLVQL